MKQVQIPSLTGLRFFAAMAVVISHAIPKIVHYGDYPPLLLRVLSATSASGMTLFFVLSGFVIYLNYSQSIATRSGLWDFFVARFARLYPLFAVAMAFDLLMKFSYNQLSPAQLVPLWHYVTLTQSWVYEIEGGRSLIYQYGLLPQVSWSISTEWAFYFVFPFICAAITWLPSRRALLIAACGLSLVALTVVMAININGDVVEAFGIRSFGAIAADPQHSFLFWLRYFSPYVRIFEFGLGCLVASIYLSLGSPSAVEERAGYWLTATALASLVCLQLAFWIPRTSHPYVHMVQQLRDNFGPAPAMALLVFCCARYSNSLVRPLSNQWIVLGGEISYSIYLLHFLIINAFRYEAAPISSWNVALGAYLQLVVVLAAIAGLSLLSWRFIEVPCRRVIRSTLSAEPSRAQVTASV